jgi:sulfonate dioxygenase
MWDNRCTAHRVIPGTYDSPRRGIRTTVFGEKPYFDPASESRRELQEREKAAEKGGQVNGIGSGGKGSVNTPA